MGELVGGNTGGYVGFFLGMSIMQLPQIILECSEVLPITVPFCNEGESKNK